MAAAISTALFSGLCSFLCKSGKYISYGVNTGQHRFFVKMPGDPLAKASLPHDERSALLFNTARLAHDVTPSALPRLNQHHSFAARAYARVTMVPRQTRRCSPQTQISSRLCVHALQSAPPRDPLSRAGRDLQPAHRSRRGVGRVRLLRWGHYIRLQPARDPTSAIWTCIAGRRSSTTWAACLARHASWRQKSVRAVPRSSNARRSSLWGAASRSF